MNKEKTKGRYLSKFLVLLERSLSSQEKIDAKIQEKNSVLNKATR